MREILHGPLIGMTPIGFVVRLRWDRTRRRVWDRLLRYDHRGACWLIWHWTLTPSCQSARSWFGWGMPRAVGYDAAH